MTFINRRSFRSIKITAPNPSPYSYSNPLRREALMFNSPVTRQVITIPWWMAWSSPPRSAWLRAFSGHQGYPPEPRPPCQAPNPQPNGPSSNPNRAQTPAQPALRWYPTGNIPILSTHLTHKGEASIAVILKPRALQAFCKMRKFSCNESEGISSGNFTTPNSVALISKKDRPVQMFRFPRKVFSHHE